MSNAIQERIAAPPVNVSSLKRYLSRPEVAEYTGIAASTINNLHTAGQGPKMIKVFGRVVYDIVDVDEWLLSFKVDPTKRSKHIEPESMAVRRGRGRPPKNSRTTAEARA